MPDVIRTDRSIRTICEFTPCSQFFPIKSEADVRLSTDQGSLHLSDSPKNNNSNLFSPEPNVYVLPLGL